MQRSRERMANVCEISTAESKQSQTKPLNFMHFYHLLSLSFSPLFFSCRSIEFTFYIPSCNAQRFTHTQTSQVKTWLELNLSANIKRIFFIEWISVREKCYTFVGIFAQKKSKCFKTLNDTSVSLRLNKFDFSFLSLDSD